MAAMVADHPGVFGFGQDLLQAGSAGIMLAVGHHSGVAAFWEGYSAKTANEILLLVGDHFDLIIKSSKTSSFTQIYPICIVIIKPISQLILDSTPLAQPNRLAAASRRPKLPSCKNRGDGLMLEWVGVWEEGKLGQI